VEPGGVVEIEAGVDEADWARLMGAMEVDRGFHG